MALSSDEIIKREIIDTLGHSFAGIKLRIFPQSSTEDQKLFADGGLMFGFNGVSYGSCDACWYIDKNWIDGFNGQEIDKTPIIALEGTDALNRKSSGNAQYQRFHHALGAVKNGSVGVYYLRKGIDKIQEDLFGMAYNASKIEKGSYLIIDDLKIVKELLAQYSKPEQYNKFIDDYLKQMKDIFTANFKDKYDDNWGKFAEKRSTILIDDYVIKYAGRMKRNFTEGSQRAGHIAVGEMYLTKYYFPNKPIYYLFPKMTQNDLEYLDLNKSSDKEWYLLRHEPNIEIKTMDDIQGLNKNTKNSLISIKDKPLKGSVLREFNRCMKEISEGLKKEKLKLTRN